VNIDSLGLHVLHNALANVAAEMGLVMMKTSYSTIFSEGLDFSTALLDREGDLIAEKNYVPSMMGAIPHTLRWTLEELGEDYFEPGDVVVHNDPYRGNCHLPEHMLMLPIFLEDELLGFAGTIGHISEVGGMAPGSFASTATEVYQEGLRLPPVKLIERGEYNRDVWRVVLANHRTPRATWGDFHAMIGSLRIGERRFLDLVRRHGLDFVRTGTAALMDYSERRMRAEIADLPDGEYSGEMWIEDDGATDQPFAVRVTLVVRGDEVIADFTGSSPQVRGPMNSTFVVIASAVYNAVFCVTDPEMSIPRNSGCYRPIKFVVPPGSVVNVLHPGPSVGGNTDAQPKIVDLLLAVFAQAVPDRAPAATGGTSNNLLIGGFHPDTGEYYSNYMADAGGTGATARKDGNSGEFPRDSNCRNTPIEVFEGRYPFRTLEYHLVPDSGGPGRYRGGLGVRRSLEVIAPEVTVSALFDRARIPPWGLFGGMPGGLTRLCINRSGDAEFRTFSEAFGTVSPTKFVNVVLHQGDILMYETPGGGGYGSPRERPPAEVLDDVRAGWVSAESAERDYGVAIRGSATGYEIDAERTARLRGGHP
jgi:N-methylhydantoinase B/oxoprolinase/acetone carboxylase alpha subunit